MEIIDIVYNAGPWGWLVVGATVIAIGLQLVTTLLAGGSWARPKLGRFARVSGLCTVTVGMLPLFFGWLGTRSGLALAEEAVAAAAPETREAMFAMGTATAQIAIDLGACSSSAIILTTTALLCLIRPAAEAGAVVVEADS